MTSFQGLDQRIVKALNKLGIEEPTEPQKLTIPKVMEGKNILLIAPTGIGKTEAAILPIFHALINNDFRPITILYITPLRALNRDMLRRMKWFGEELGLDIAVRHGDTSQKERNRQSKHPPQVLITTPETLQVMFTGSKLREHLKNIRCVVVDEVHELAGDERGAQLSVALERLSVLGGRDFQRIGLSATVGSPEEVARFLAGAGRKIEIVRVSMEKRMDIRVESPEPKKGDKVLADTLRSDKKTAASIRRCKELIDGHRSTLFFVNTRDTGESLAARYRLWDEDYPIGIHHGSLSKQVRVQMEDEFKGEILKALICTSSLELGIDVGSADFTIQFNSPREVTRLIQRVGRAGHKVGERSEGVIIAVEPDDVAESLVIARKALGLELEELRIRENPMSVLANQIVAFAMTRRRNSVDEAYETIRRAYPFRNLEKDRFIEILRLLNELRVIWFDENREFGKSRPSLSYFYDNISMIPDEKTYKVRDAGTRGIVGTLDEVFVASYAEPGAVFIIKGRTWRIVDVTEDTVLVEEIRDIGAIPNWVGEEIPVPFDVAVEVGKLRRTGNYDSYPGDDSCADVYKEYLAKQKDLPVATDKRIVIESGKRLIIINACLGTRVNETLGRLLSSLLSAKLGESIGLSSDAYRIVLELPRNIKPEMIRELLMTTDSRNIHGLLKIMLRNSTYINRQFLYSAKKFGAVKKGADFRSMSISRLIKAYYDTPLFEEVIETTLWEEMDVARTSYVLDTVQSGEMEVAISKISHMGLSGYETGKEYMVPARADHSILMALKRRLEEESIVLVCMNCKKGRHETVKSVPEKVICPVCSSVLVAGIRTYDEKDIKLLKKKMPAGDEKKRVQRLYTAANLVISHGKKAVLALVGRGVGPDTAARILRNYHENEDDFLKDVLAAEINYARTKKFWD